MNFLGNRSVVLVATERGVRVPTGKTSVGWDEETLSITSTTFEEHTGQVAGCSEAYYVLYDVLKK